MFNIYVSLTLIILCLRNLAKVLKVPAKPWVKMNGRKRPRDDSLDPRVVKQRRFHSDDLGKHARNKEPLAETDNSSTSQSSSQSSSSGLNGWSEQEMDSPDIAHHTAISTSVNVQESLKPQEVRVKLKASKKTAGFRDLLAQMRANTSIIIREPCQ